LFHKEEKPMSQTIQKYRKMTAIIVALLLAVLLVTSFASADAGSAQQCTWTHLVRPGDTLSVIARFYGVKVSDILKLNSQITNPNLIFWGTTLCVSNTVSAPQLLPGNYVIQPGDTLGYIAFRFGASLSDLIRANGLGNPNLILAGDTLTVPTQEVVPTTEVTSEPTVVLTTEATIEATVEPTQGATLEATPDVIVTPQAAG
jgi:LysM repeat protein